MHFAPMFQFIQDLTFGRGPLLIELHQCTNNHFFVKKTERIRLRFKQYVSTCLALYHWILLLKNHTRIFIHVFKKYNA